MKPLWQAARDNDIERIKEASDSQLLDCTCPLGCSVLHWAAGSNHVELCRYLIPLFPRNNTSTHRRTYGRTPLHYAGRNGALETAQVLITVGADPNPVARDGVTPLQLAVWRNHLDVAQWLVRDCNVDIHQVNHFDCGLIHWLGTAPVECSGIRDDPKPEVTGDALIPTAKWLVQQGVDIHSRQRQGHSALHKAAWGGHLALVQYWHQCGLWDDVDESGNWAADLADMGQTARHARVADYLRQYCHPPRRDACAILGISLEDSRDLGIVRQAYLQAAKFHHPDKQTTTATEQKFDEISQAYDYLQTATHSHSNPAHSLSLMIESCPQTNATSTDPTDDNHFVPRLLAVVLEYGSDGLDVSNLHRKWAQLWPDAPFSNYYQKEQHGPLAAWLRQQSIPAIRIVQDPPHVRLYAS